MADLNTAQARGFATGLPGFGVVPRQDIDVLLQKEPDTFNLFVLALRELQQEKPGQNPPLWQDKMSFFQLAGIHGLPNKPWDNVQGKGRVSEQNGSGYCNHSTPTFPTWHRPYLAIFEQTLYKKMQDIAALYTDPARKAKYQEAVKKFRLPFIDYHRPRNFDATFPGVVNPNRGSTSYPYDFSLPQVLTLADITVRDFPADNIRTISNPLASFRFPTGSVTEQEWSVSGISPNADMKSRTIRYPLNRFSRWDPLTAVNAAVNEIREETVRLSLLFIENGAYGNYETYASNGASARDIDGKTASGSLESVHGNYHVFIGGSGHMSSVPTAAFDPVFWLHHCTIDRWFAVWQKSHPQSWFRDRGMAARPLIPFRNAANQGSNPYWTSDQSISTEAFGYTYPELVGGPNPAQVQKRWGDQYGWARRLTPQANPNVKPTLSEFEPLNLSAAQVFQGIREFKPLTRSTSNQLLPNVNNLAPQPLRRAMAAPVVEGQKPLVPPAERKPLSAMAADLASKATIPVAMVAGAVGIQATPETAKPAATVAVMAGAASAGALKAAHDTQASNDPSSANTAPVVTAESAIIPQGSKPNEIKPPSNAEHKHSTPVATDHSSAGPVDEAKVSREWYVDDVVERLALNTSFTVLYFIGQFTDSDSLVGLMMAPTFAGLNHVFAAPIEACDNCEQQEGVAHMVRSTSPITSMLLDYVGTGELQSMRPEHVRPFLVKNLKWRVVTVDGRVINPRELSANHGFKNSVSCKVSPLPGQTGEVLYETYNDITAQIISNSS